MTGPCLGCQPVIQLPARYTEHGGTVADHVVASDDALRIVRARAREQHDLAVSHRRLSGLRWDTAAGRGGALRRMYGARSQVLPEQLHDALVGYLGEIPVELPDGPE
jgi:hypothetical protein